MEISSAFEILISVLTVVLISLYMPDLGLL